MEHVRVGVYSLTKGTFEEAAKLAQEGMLPVFQEQPGFIRYGLAGGADGSVLSISLWETHDEAEAASVLAADWVREHIADRVQLREQFIGDFAFYTG